MNEALIGRGAGGGNVAPGGHAAGQSGPDALPAASCQSVHPAAAEPDKTRGFSANRARPTSALRTAEPDKTLSFCAVWRSPRTGAGREPDKTI